MAGKTRGKLKGKAHSKPTAAGKPSLAGEGFLVAENTTTDNLAFGSFRVKGEDSGDLTIPYLGAQVIDDIWLKVPHFARAVNKGQIVLTRSALPPDLRSFDVPNNLRLDDPILNGQAIGIVSKADYDEISRGLIFLEPHRRQDDNVDVDFLKSTFVKFLKNVEYREGQFRNRKPLLRDIRLRLDLIRAM